jgi:hypothetical protein
LILSEHGAYEWEKNSSNELLPKKTKGVTFSKIAQVILAKFFSIMEMLSGGEM